MHGCPMYGCPLATKISTFKKVLLLYICNTACTCEWAKYEKKMKWNIFFWVAVAAMMAANSNRDSGATLFSPVFVHLMLAWFLARLVFIRHNRSTQTWLLTFAIEKFKTKQKTNRWHIPFVIRSIFKTVYVHTLTTRHDTPSICQWSSG